MNISRSLMIITFCVLCFSFSSDKEFSESWKNYNLPVDQRIEDLISELTLDEKISQLLFNSSAIPRLGIQEYNWWNECLHGVARNGRATVFPQAIGLAATFDDKLIFDIATAISDEARAKFTIAQKIGNYSRYSGLTFWTPNVNIFRDPRWGRGQETYGEDPYLTSRMGVAFVKGLQGDHSRYLKAAACAKHYAVHSGPEADRHVFNAIPPKKDFFETYLPAFESLVKEAHVEAVMCAYNRTYDDPCCGSPYLLKEILREKWGFDGHIVSDCWAIVDFYEHHKVTPGPAESAALAIKSGVNVNCGNTYPYLREAYDQNLISEEHINSALRPLLKTRFKLGLFDPPELNPYNKIPREVINCADHQDLAYEAAVKSIVLLKNENKTLPLNQNIRNLYVLGPHATSAEVLLGNYYGASGNMINILEGIISKSNPGTTVEYKHAFLPYRENINPVDWTTGEAGNYDAIVVVMGYSGLLEGEEGEALASPTKGDRLDIGLPENQVNYIKKLRNATDKPIITVITGGSPAAIPEIHELVDAILWVWYPGEQGGNAVADIIYGNRVPSGKLPVTFPKSVNQLPDYEDYSMKGRTYKYMKDEPLYPFGYGLSYTKFDYRSIYISKEKISEDENLSVKCTIENTGEFKGEEVVQMYITDKQASFEVPHYSLQGFKRIELEPGQRKTVEFTITPSMLHMVNDNGEKIIEKGEFIITMGGNSPMKASHLSGLTNTVSTSFMVE